MRKLFPESVTSVDSVFVWMVEKSFSSPCLLNNSMVTSIPKSAWTVAMFFVLKNPFKYAVAGYGVFNCVKGGVINNTGASKTLIYT